MTPRIRRLTRPAAPTLLVAAALAAAAISDSRGDTVVLNNGLVYRGTVDKDKPLLWVYDGLKRVALRDSKVRGPIVSDASFRNLEVFKLEQPMVVHSGSMPRAVVSVKAEPWNDRGRRAFAYEGAKLGAFVKMEQAIIELGPHLVRIRGVDGFWQGQLATGQVPRETVLAILAKVEQADRNERVRVARFLIQAGWFAEARAELDRIVKDFPADADLRERVTAARASVGQLEAVEARAEIDRCRLAQRPREARSLLKAFPGNDAPADLFESVRELGRADDAQAAADAFLGDDLRTLADRLPEEARGAWRKPLLEMLRALNDAPDAVRDRFVAWQKAKAEGKASAEALFALAASGYVVGADAAVDELGAARTVWEMRDRVRVYLSSREPDARTEALSGLEAATVPAASAQAQALKKLDTVTRLAVRMAPPLHRDEEARAASASTADASPTPARRGARIRRVGDDDNSVPTEYAVFLPPEYHPLRSYPAVVALHDGTGGPQGAIDWWSAEAAKHGYIVVAPEYRLPGQGKDYRYSSSEHAAVELALRDARRRYAIDSDRVFLGGQLAGANMAWDFGQAHPDLFAGVVVISGLPYGFVNRYLANLDRDRLPLYVVLGDLAPAANELVFAEILKPLILKAYDVTYLEYHRRGLESFPEEAPAVFDWMDRRRREPYPKSFDVVTARPSDNRFYGVVVRELQPGRAMAPEAVDPFGKNLNPAKIKYTTSALSNLVRLETTGVKALDVWVSPKLIDFSRKFEVRVNGTPRKGLARPDLGPLLEDLRVRGDRQQVYWFKLSVP